MIVDAAQQACELPGRHAPRNLTTELHHIIPVAWQLFWQPPAPPFPGKDQDGRGMLWDDRGIWLCPTSHRNAHHWIVQMMRAQAAGGGEDPQVAYRAISAADRRRPEFPVAFMAVTRFVTVGGSLQALIAASEWGQM